MRRALPASAFLGLMRLCLLTLVTVAALPARAEGQQFGLDLTVSNRHVWHGITRKNGYGAQGDGYVMVRRRDLWLTAGVWANLELEQSGRFGLTDRGTGRWGFTEVDYWVEASVPWEGIESTLGWTAYTFVTPDPSPGRDGEFNTHEVYARVRLRSLYLSPHLSAYYDVDRVDGMYLEGGVTLPVLANPTGRPYWSLFLGATAGFNVGQGPNTSEPAELANFDDRGITHLDLSAAFNLKAPVFPAGTQVVLHLQFNRDAATERDGIRPSDRRDRTFWFAVVTSLPSLGGED